MSYFNRPTQESLTGRLTETFLPGKNVGATSGRMRAHCRTTLTSPFVAS
jgi:hypothetical protein